MRGSVVWIRVELQSIRRDRAGEVTVGNTKRGNRFVQRVAAHDHGTLAARGESPTPPACATAIDRGDRDGSTPGPTRAGRRLSPSACALRLQLVPTRRGSPPTPGERVRRARRPEYRAHAETPPQPRCNACRSADEIPRRREPAQTQAPRRDSRAEARASRTESPERGCRRPHDSIVPIPEVEKRARDLLFDPARDGVLHSRVTDRGAVWPGAGSRRERAPRIVAFSLRLVRETEKQ